MSDPTPREVIATTIARAELRDADVTDLAGIVQARLDAAGWQVTRKPTKEGAPAIAAAVLEAAGVEPLPEEVAVDRDDPEDLTRFALRMLKRALVIREYHAKPRVTDAQVAEIAEAVTGQSTILSQYRVRDITRQVLQAALDSGVLQVPADNKEADR